MTKQEKALLREIAAFSTKAVCVDDSPTKATPGGETLEWVKKDRVYDVVGGALTMQGPMVVVARNGHVVQPFANSALILASRFKMRTLCNN